MTFKEEYDWYGTLSNKTMSHKLLLLKHGVGMDFFINPETLESDRDDGLIAISNSQILTQEWNMTSFKADYKLVSATKYFKAGGKNAKRDKVCAAFQYLLSYGYMETWEGVWR